MEYFDLFLANKNGIIEREKRFSNQLILIFDMLVERRLFSPYHITYASTCKYILLSEIVLTEVHEVMNGNENQTIK